MILEAPVELVSRVYSGGSQFGCLVDAFESGRGDFDLMQQQQVDGFSLKNLQMKQVFLTDLSRLIQYLRWISRGCDMPTCNVIFTYSNRNGIRRSQEENYNTDQLPREV